MNSSAVESKDRKGSFFGSFLEGRKSAFTPELMGGPADGAGLLKLCKMLNIPLGLGTLGSPDKQGAADWLRHCRRPLIEDR